MYIYVCTYRRPTAGVLFRLSLSRSDASKHHESASSPSLSLSLSLPFLIHTLTSSFSNSLSLAFSLFFFLSLFPLLTLSIVCSACQYVTLSSVSR